MWHYISPTTWQPYAHGPSGLTTCLPKSLCLNPPVCKWMVKLCDPSLTRAKHSALEMSITHMRYTNVLFTYLHSLYHLHVIMSLTFLYSERMMLVVGGCSSYAAMTKFGAWRTCQHTDYGTWSSCQLTTPSSTWPYWPCVNIPSSLLARSAGGPPGLPTAPPSTTRTGHALVHDLPLPQVTPTIFRLTGFHCDSGSLYTRNLKEITSSSSNSNSVTGFDRQLSLLSLVL